MSVTTSDVAKVGELTVVQGSSDRLLREKAEGKHHDRPVTLCLRVPGVIAPVTTKADLDLENVGAGSSHWQGQGPILSVDPEASEVLTKLGFGPGTMVKVDLGRGCKGTITHV